MPWSSLGEHVVIDAIAPARIAGLFGTDAYAYRPAHQHVGQNGVVGTVVAQDSPPRAPMTVFARRVLPPE